MVSARSDSRPQSVVCGRIAAAPGETAERVLRPNLSDISTMLKQSRTSEPSIAAVVANRGAMRANASVVSVKAGQPFSNLPGRRASSATLRRAAPVFKTRVERETYQIGGIEGCLDKVEIIAGRRFSPIAEIELELKSGDRRELFTLARQFLRLYRQRSP